MPTLRSNKPSALITMGDPSGIGPEVTLKAITNPSISKMANFLIIGDRFVIEKAKKDLRIKCDAPVFDLANVDPAKFSYGRVRPYFGAAAIQYIDKALELLKAKEADILVTAPINKASVEKAGWKNFKGHTEYLASNTATKDFAMMLVGARLRVVLVTRHLPLKKVPGAISQIEIKKSALLAHKYLKRYFRIGRPRIGVCGLNPHAGDNNLFGVEESSIITPAVDVLKRRIGRVSGPIAPDAIFHEAVNGKFDAVVCMYHDQGLIPFKTLYFKNGVNLTLGLPFIRTSPDHGTAFDIAGKGKADPSSMEEAIRLACRLHK